MHAFISYSHKDRQALDRLHTHLAVLRREGNLVGWYDREILAGADVDKDIAGRLADSDIFLALVSPDFLASSYCYEREMAEAIARHEKGTMRLVPIILEPCDWKATPLQRFKALPRDGKPVSEWTNANTAYLDVVTELRRLATAMLSAPAGAGTGSPSRSDARRYRVKRDFDEIDRSDFRQACFDGIRAYFESATAELSGIDDLRARVNVLGPTSFTCTVINRAKQKGVAHLTVHAGSSGFRDISFNHQENGSSNTSNGMYSIAADDYDLFLRGSPAFGSGRDEKLTAHQVAEQLWTDLLERAGVTIHD